MAPSERITVLLLGLGGNVSQGILKALHASRVPTRVVGACVTPDAAGLFGVDRAYVSPYAADPGFPEWLFDVCRREKVDAVLSGVEAVLAVLAEHGAQLQAADGAVCIVSPPEVLRVAADKLATAEWLQAHGLNSARGADSGDGEAMRILAEECGYPLIAKPRIGSGSRGIFEVNRQEDLERVGGLPGYMLQQVVGAPDAEYTVGCFSDRHGRLAASIAMRRSLSAGTSASVEIGAFPEVQAQAEAIVGQLHPTGPCNVQLRIGPEGPTCFEINARFSGTAPIRAHFGFNDVEAALRHFVMGEAEVNLPVVTAGRAVRYWNEVYIEADAINALDRGEPLDNPAQRAQYATDIALPQGDGSPELNMSDAPSDEQRA